jgi:diaminopimelate decarboxylase
MNKVFPVSATVTSEGVLAIGGVSASELAETFGTPLYVLDYRTIEAQAMAYREALSRHTDRYLVCYACKANLTVSLATHLSSLGVGFDVVSSGELLTVISAGADTDHIVFHGNNKLAREVRLAVSHNVRLVVDHLGELELIKTVCAELGKRARILLRLKPLVDPNTHDYIKTGQADSKFGIDDQYLDGVVSYIKAHECFEFLGLHAHIGSQISELEPYLKLVDVMGAYLAEFHSTYQLPVSELDLGGGFSVAYLESDPVVDIGGFIDQMMQRLGMMCVSLGISLPKIILEPGRSMIAQSGVTLYRVGAVKEVPDIRTFVFVDGGMADNMRPVLYRSKYTYEVANKMALPKSKVYAIAGKYCESGDILATDVRLPVVVREDIIAVAVTGAYNYAMASTYNRVGRPAMVMVRDGVASVMVRRETDEDLCRFDEGVA